MKTFCKECGRETFVSARGTTQQRRDAACASDVSFSGASECQGYVEGRRAGLKEAQRIADHLTFAGPLRGFVINADMLKKDIRAALKAPKVSK